MLARGFQIVRRPQPLFGGRLPRGATPFGARIRARYVEQPEGTALAGLELTSRQKKRAARCGPLLKSVLGLKPSEEGDLAFLGACEDLANHLILALALPQGQPAQKAVERGRHVKGSENHERVTCGTVTIVGGASGFNSTCHLQIPPFSLMWPVVKGFQ